MNDECGSTFVKTLEHRRFAEFCDSPSSKWKVKPAPIKSMQVVGNASFDCYNLCSDFSISAARSPIMTQGAIVLPVVTRGMIEPSTIRTVRRPLTVARLSSVDAALLLQR